MATKTSSIRDLMTPDPVTCDVGTTIADAARQMRDDDIGDVLVTRDGALCGIVTDRDIVVRAVAEGNDPTTTQLGEICTRDVRSLSPDASVDDAIRAMSEQAVRRLPVCEGDRVLGIVSLGDLAVDRDPESLLGDISAAPPSN